MTVQKLIATHPHPTSVDREALLRCIDDCFDCAATCISCADACLGEDDVRDLVRCIRLCLDCADACDATRRCEQSCNDLLVTIRGGEQS